MKYFILFFISVSIYAQSCEDDFKLKIENKKREYLKKFNEGSSSYYEINQALNNIHLFIKESEDEVYLEASLSFLSGKLYQKRKKRHEQVLKEFYGLYDVGQTIKYQKAANCKSKALELGSTCIGSNPAPDILNDEVSRILDLGTALMIQENIKIRRSSGGICHIDFDEYVNEVESKSILGFFENEEQNSALFMVSERLPDGSINFQNNGSFFNLYYKGIKLNVDLSPCARDEISSEIQVVSDKRIEKVGGKEYLKCDFSLLKDGKVFSSKKEILGISADFNTNNNCAFSGERYTCSKEIESKNTVNAIKVSAKIMDQVIEGNCFDNESFPKVYNFSSSTRLVNDGQDVNCSVSISLNPKGKEGELDAFSLSVDGESKDSSFIQGGTEGYSLAMQYKNTEENKTRNITIKNLINGESISINCNTPENLYTTSATQSLRLGNINGGKTTFLDSEKCKNTQVKVCKNGEPQKIWLYNCSAIPCLEDGGGWEPTDLAEKDRCEFEPRQYCPNGELRRLNPVNCKLLSCEKAKGDSCKDLPVKICNDGTEISPSGVLCEYEKCRDGTTTNRYETLVCNKKEFLQCANGETVKLDKKSCEYPKCETFPEVSIKKINRKCQFSIDNEPILVASKFKYHFDEDEMSCSDSTLSCSVDNDFIDSSTVLFVEYNGKKKRHKCTIPRVKNKEERETKKSSDPVVDTNWAAFLQTLGKGNQYGNGAQSFNPYMNNTQAYQQQQQQQRISLQNPFGGASPNIYQPNMQFYGMPFMLNPYGLMPPNMYQQNHFSPMIYQHQQAFPQAQGFNFYRWY